MQTNSPNEHRVFLSNDPAGRREIRLALIGLLFSLALFVATAPFLKTPLPEVGAFIPIYASAMILSYLITAVLLFGQFNALRLKSLLVLASGYLFVAFVAASHLLAFPGVFSPNGVFGGSQNAAWFWSFWHAGFPLFVIAHVLLKNREVRATTIATTEGSPSGRGIGFALIAAAMMAFAATLVSLAVATRDFLPELIENGSYTPAATVVWCTTWTVSCIALAALWRRPHRTMLDIWLIVVMGAWLFDIGLSASFNGSRYDLGWYAGRLYGLLAAASLLCMLLVETTKQASDLAKANKRTYDLLQIRTVERDSAHHKTEVAQAANAILDEFVATASHELRTPLTAIAASIGLLVNGTVGAMPPGAARLIKIAHLNTQRMVRLINDILDIAKLDAGKMPFNLGPVNLCAVAEQVIEANRPYAATYEASVQLDGGTEICWVRADADRLMQVLANLLSNAVKFSPVGATVAVSIGQQADMGRIVVRDRGIGIPEAFRSRIFQKFAQADATDTRQRGGTGLGLSIVQQIVIRHGGKIHFEPAPGGGTIFVVEIPLWIKPALLQAQGADDVQPPGSTDAIAISV